ncbi:hypothetical protein FB567DRAFT_445023 [Paraphoma chrysanthemicola]|uniref:DUF7357 domain-containing protein n=1 Tax=Paraphoma chrysanthemicola TaxID=798071 RepID=A0A8K0VX58_9PLEO|nr:hypothetical protein FB567DRAFT_445023 [Paraphoma chrysanthemicola]
MRLRLTVQRNGLPAANVLWNVSESNSTQAYTITRLLEDVNHVIPLEAEHWGLEHYVVELGGFECLHFSPVVQALKDDDHVTIRPLLTAEERARTLTGRHQISDDGRHLVDGIPFGRPYLRHPSRPAVRIPPRKRRRLDDADEEVEVAGLLTENAETLSLQGEVDFLTGGLRSPAASRHSRTSRSSKRVQFKAPLIDDEDEDEDSDEDDEDFAPNEAQDGDDSIDAASEDDSDTDSDSSDASNASSSDSDDASSDSESDEESDASSPPEVMSSKGTPAGVLRPAQAKPLVSPQHVAPGNGRGVTRSRNSRRTRTNRLRLLKAAGKLAPDADLKAMAEYEAGHNQETQAETGPEIGVEGELVRTFDAPTGKRKRADEEEATDDTPELTQRKEELMARFGEAAAVTMVQLEASLQEPTVAQQPAPPKHNAEQEEPAAKETPKKRLRPDTSAISRILARQAMPSTRKTNKAKPVPVEPPEPEGASDPDFWKSRINLSAFECWDEEFELSAPPFPFEQHWDPASKLMREKADKKRQKKKKHREPMPAQEEEEEEKIYLDYDDTGATEHPDAAINAAIEDQLRQDVATAAEADLPSIPEDLSTLANLTSADIKKGAVIVCKFFAVNPVTITPEVSDFKTAVVEQEGDSGNGAGTIRLKIAQRDLPKRDKKFDSKGNRVYDAADQFYMEDEEEDEGLWEGQYSELIEPRLLKAA